MFWIEPIYSVETTLIQIAKASLTGVLRSVPCGSHVWKRQVLPSLRRITRGAEEVLPNGCILRAEWGG